MTTKIIVSYWRGTMQLKGTARSYRGAMRIASRNQNAYPPTFEDGDGKSLFDDGNGLAYEEHEATEGKRLYAVIGS